MTPKQIAEIRARADAVMPGEWGRYGMDPGEREMYLVRGVRALRGYGQTPGIDRMGGRDREDMKLFDFLSIFHPEMSHEQKVAMVLEAYPDSTIKREAS